MTTNETTNKIHDFFSAEAFAVVGASTNKNKYGNKVLRCYLQNEKKVFPVNPSESKIEGLTCVKNLAALPKEVMSISIITPPSVTEVLVKEAIKMGIKNIWMQPGAESDEAINECNRQQINIIAQGPCILIELGFVDK